MGGDDKRPQLYANVCGEWKPVTLIDATPVLEAAIASAEIAAEIAPEPIRIRATLPKYFRCRSRKRLIKLLMANKLSRNEAGRIARQVCESGLSYQAVWSQIWPQLMYM